METTTTTEANKVKPGRKKVSELSDSAKLGMCVRYIKSLGFTYDTFTEAYASKKKELDELERLEAQLKAKKEKLGL